MQAFGIEIRKANTIGALYENVDAVLEKTNLAKMQVAAIGHSLQNMMSVDRHFSICTIDNCMKICQIVIKKEHYDIYHSQHCMHWNQMTDEFRQSLIAMVLDDFRSVLNPDLNN